MRQRSTEREREKEKGGEREQETMNSSRFLFFFCNSILLESICGFMVKEYGHLMAGHPNN